MKGFVTTALLISIGFAGCASSKHAQTDASKTSPIVQPNPTNDTGSVTPQKTSSSGNNNGDTVVPPDIHGGMTGGGGMTSGGKVMGHLIKLPRPIDPYLPPEPNPLQNPSFHPFFTGGTIVYGPTAAPLPSNTGAIIGNLTSYIPYAPFSPSFSISGTTNETNWIGGTGGSDFSAVHCDDQSAIVAYRFRQGDAMDQLVQIGCKNINQLNQGGIVWKDVHAGGNGGSDKTYLAPRGYVMTGWSGKVGSEGGHDVFAAFRPYSNPIDTGSGIIANDDNPTDGGWYTWNNDGTKMGWGEDQGTLKALCPAGSLLIGVRGKSGDFLDSLIGICQPLVVTHPSVPFFKNNLSLAGSTSMAPIGGHGGGELNQDCDENQVVVAIKVRYRWFSELPCVAGDNCTSNPDLTYVGAISFGCKGINHLYDQSPIDWKQEVGSINSADSEEIVAPYGYALAGLDASHGSTKEDGHDLVKTIQPWFLPVNESGIDTTSEFVEKLDHNLGPDAAPTLQSNTCAPGSLMTGMVTRSGDALDSVETKCRAVVSQ